MAIGHPPSGSACRGALASRGLGGLRLLGLADGEPAAREAVGTGSAVARAILTAVFAALAVLPRSADCASTTPAGERSARYPAVGVPAAVVPVTKVIAPTRSPACSGIAEGCTTPVAAMAMFAVASPLGTDSCRVVFVGDPCRR